ncbi:MAG: hypothetical protein K0R62_6002 [Nonomuraea muscovyensis]|nr:hypothetical protein [Nonomuraea muscovyensis]
MVVKPPLGHQATRPLSRTLSSAQPRRPDRRRRPFSQEEPSTSDHPLAHAYVNGGYAWLAVLAYLVIISPRILPP